MEPFFKYAKQFGGKCGALNQVDYINKFALETRDGVCYGLCISYIALHAKGINFGSVREQKPTWMFVDGLQRAYDNFHDFRAGFSRFVPEWARVSASLAGLRVLGCNQGVGPSYIEISNALRAHQGGALLAIGRHACAVFKEKDGRVRFFEPNYGQATFVAWNSFIAFLSCFLHDHKIERQYGYALNKKISVYWYELV
ncbi:MAG: YopT-type cysteine protease domain-containing protein [Negativicutes bacterium]|uniref:YopT-type cysteine protease domain-containing protein n=1 Tax=Pseudomonas sp. MWU13-2100 TaxID=2935075 RepID=UPI00200E080C|nr:YopT-type cysteine protease domain-containing protein [Pseudomonas sp. MWU13-2100]MDR3560822.1 YopT-type cysteine protease domain-containing protein [Negativicutes bacterium]